MNPAKKETDQATYSGRFAARLRLLREKAGLTVDEVVAAMELQGYTTARRSIYNWEQAKTSPPLNAFPLLAQVLKLKTVRSLIPEE